MHKDQIKRELAEILPEDTSSDLITRIATRTVEKSDTLEEFDEWLWGNVSRDKDFTRPLLHYYLKNKIIRKIMQDRASFPGGSPTKGHYFLVYLIGGIMFLLYLPILVLNYIVELTLTPHE